MDKNKNRKIPVVNPSGKVPPVFTTLAATNAIFNDVLPSVKKDNIDEAKDWVESNEK